MHHDLGTLLDTEISPLRKVNHHESENEILILCGLDGVIIEPEPEAHVASHIDAVRDIWGVEIQREEFWDALSGGGLTDRTIAKQLLVFKGIDVKNIPGHEVNRWRVRCGELFEMYTGLSEFQPLAQPHAVNGLAMATSIKNITLSIATGNLQKIAERKLALTDMLGYFNSGGGYGDFTLNRVELLKDALYTANWDPQDSQEKASMQKRIYLIGDTVHDMKAARELDLNAVGLATGSAGVKELIDAGASIVFMRFDRAISWIINQTERTWTATEL